MILIKKYINRIFKKSLIRRFARIEYFISIVAMLFMKDVVGLGVTIGHIYETNVDASYILI